MRLVPCRTFGCSLLLLLACLTSLVQAASPITGSGLNTQISPAVILPSGQTQYNITGGTRPGGGTNLFHSFGDFNVPTNNIANFLNNSGLPTSNILGRVTGGNASVIYGLIQTNGPGGFGNANLFLMNPAGFLFGPNATLNVGGMVAFTTADYLRFQGTQTVFDQASTPQSLSLLTSAPVAAFGFLGSNPSSIAIQGSTLQVAQGQSLSLVGGNKGFTATDPDNGNPVLVPDGITMTGGKLLAPGGQINIASVAGPGEISAIDFLPTTGMATGNISLSQGALLDVSADAAGTVRIRGGQLVMNDATISADTVNANGALVAIDINVAGDVTTTSVDVPVLSARTTGSGNAGEVRISSQNFESTATALTTFISSVIDTHTSGSGKAGDVNMTTTENLKVTTDNSGFIAFIDSGTTGPDGGHGGNVTLNAKNVDIERAQIVTGDLFALFNGEIAAGSGGNLRIYADTLTLVNSGFATTAASAGRGGELTFSARDVQIVQGSFLDANGAIGGGRIQINADHLLVDSSQLDSGGGIVFNGRIGEFKEGSTVSTSTGMDVNAGDITFTATERLTFADFTTPDATPIRPSGLYSTSVFPATGSSGAIIVNTPVLQLLGGARFDATTSTTGHGGSISITAETISISGERPLPIFEGPLFGLGASLASGIYSRTVIQRGFCIDACGNAGPISITTGNLSILQGGRIDSSTGSPGTGGDITIKANQVAIDGRMIDGTPGGIFTTAANAGAGGNIILNASSVMLQNSGTLSAATSGTAPSATGGTITVSVEQVALNSHALITTDTNGIAPAGVIDINAGTLAISDGGQIRSTSGAERQQLSTLALSPTGPLTGGTITVQGLSGAGSQAESVTIDGSGSGIFSQSTGNRPGGDIYILTSGSVNLSNGATISVNSTGTGNAGNIQINAGNQLAMTNSTVTTEAHQASGGAIKITTTPSGTVELTDSTISASVLDGTGGGGSVNIDPQFVILQNSQILANAVFGPGGNINITTNLLLPDSTSVISASSQFGQQGTVIIQSPASPASGKIIPLGQKPLPATTLLSQRCAALSGGSVSSFTVAGRDMLPSEPGNWLSTPLALNVAGESEASPTSHSSVEEVPLLSLRRIAPPGFLTQSFAVESSGCTS